jgi:hypothetical protein
MERSVPLGEFAKGSDQDAPFTAVQPKTLQPTSSHLWPLLLVEPYFTIEIITLELK